MSSDSAHKLLLLSAKCWFVVAMTGQIIFALYVALHYGPAGIDHDMAKANSSLPHGFESGNHTGNAFLGLHLLLATYISAAGAVQLIPRFRSTAPKFHRWNGRAYLISAVLMALSGLYLVYGGRKQVGDVRQGMAITLNAILILTTAFLTVRTAIGRQFADHHKWALRLSSPRG